MVVMNYYVDINIIEYQNGEQKLMGFFIGQAMKATKGQGNPKIVKEILEKLM